MTINGTLVISVCCMGFSSHFQVVSNEFSVRYQYKLLVCAISNAFG